MMSQHKNGLRYILVLVLCLLSCCLLSKSQERNRVVIHLDDQEEGRTSHHHRPLHIESHSKIHRKAPPTPTDWTEAQQKAKKFISNLNLDEKISLAAGVTWMVGRCVGNTPEIKRVGFPGLCLQDSPLGVRFTDLVTAFPTGINTAATWDRDLAYLRAVAMADEFRNKGVNAALGPMMNMGRVAAGGRNWEGFGPDPYQVGEFSYQTVLGIQSQGVIATAKHYVGNEQEHFRTLSSSNIDDKTMHEVYLYPFARSVDAGVGSVMCSYNLVNNTYACENPTTLSLFLKQQLNFQGFVMSDWDAMHSSVLAVQAGMDMTMPGTATFSKEILQAVKNQSISMSRIDDMATRILAPYYLLNQDDNYPPVNFDSFRPNNATTDLHVNVQKDHKIIARQIAAASVVLLKNNQQMLPLVNRRSIAVIGSDAGPAIRGANGCVDHGCSDGHLAMGWGSGTANFPYLSTPLGAIQSVIEKQGTSSLSWFLDDFDTVAAANTAKLAEVAIVFVSSNSGEEYLTVEGNNGDRNNLTLWRNGEALIRSVADVNPNTIVVINSVGPIEMTTWIDHPNVKGVLMAGVAGQESGNGLADVLFGDVNPSGKLPYTIARQRSDYPAEVVYNKTENIAQIPYKEGVFIDYRHFDQMNIAPLFEFGFGLSYTSFKYSDLSVNQNGTDIHIRLSLTNVGQYGGSEVVQLYLAFPAAAQQPPRVLRGFEKVKVEKSASQPVEFQLHQRDLSYWNTNTQSWRVAPGLYNFVVGASSRDFRLSGSFSISS